MARAREALAAGRWEEARRGLEAVPEQEASAEVLLGIGRARWWLGDASGAVEHIERAYAKLRQHAAVNEAGVSAVWLSVIYKKSLGSQAACGGWLGRARRLLEDLGPGPLQGWLDWAGAIESLDPQRAVALATSALDHALRGGDRDLELCALAELGNALVAVGRVDEGLALVDEAMAGTFGGEFARFETVSATTCSMLVACDLAADLARIQQWCQVADSFIRTYGCPFLYADCRTRYGSVLLATGHWKDSERELTAAIRATPPETEYYAQALARLVELRLRQGRVEEADTLLVGVSDRSCAQLAVGAVRHAQGDHAVAAAILRRHLTGCGARHPRSAPALGLLVEVHLAAGDLLAAAEAVDELANLASELAGDGIRALAAQADGGLAAAGGDRERAVSRLEAAMEGFGRAKLPYESARARLALAAVLAGDQPKVAAAEAQVAFAAFDDLGALPAADQAAALLRSLGVHARTGPKDFGVLSKREQEVLRLVAAGLSNPEIGKRLFISRKTVAHHVSGVLSKLGLRNRSEAAAYATRALTGLDDSPGDGR